MIAYPDGQQPDFWDPRPADARHRFALGRIGGCSAGLRPLVVIAMNPSHARETQSDRTVNHVINVSMRKHPGWLMLNLYPERSPKPTELKPYDAGLSATNCAAIERALKLVDATEVLAGWGNMGGSMTLKRALLDIRALLSNMGVRTYTLDPLLKTGNPAHPHPPGRPLPMLGPKMYLS